MSNEYDRKLNLSWVLREPSTSHAVAQALRANRRFQRRRDRIIRTFQSMNDVELRERVYIEPHFTGVSVAPAHIVTASIGMYEFLTRALSLSGVLNDGLDESRLTVVDRCPVSGTSEHDFFCGTAQLALPSDFDSGGPVLVAGLIVRPGEQDMLLTIGVIQEPYRDYSAVLRELEAIVRDHVTQWFPERALWANPMEIERPEILQFASSTAER